MLGCEEAGVGPHGRDHHPAGLRDNGGRAGAVAQSTVSRSINPSFLGRQNGTVTRGMSAKRTRSARSGAVHEVMTCFTIFRISLIQDGCGRNLFVRWSLCRAARATCVPVGKRQDDRAGRIERGCRRLFWTSSGCATRTTHVRRLRNWITMPGAQRREGTSVISSGVLRDPS